VLIDASPDLRWQLVREDISHIDYLFLTHWHYDHFAGLGELEYYVRLVRQAMIPFYLPPGAVESYANAFPNLSDVLQPIPWEFGRNYDFGNVSLMPLPANHGIETAGIRLETADNRLAYFTDTAGLPEMTAGGIEEPDWLFCDATFHGENWFPGSHMSVDQAIALGKQVKAKHTVLIHLSMHYSRPVTTKELEREIAGHPGVLLASDGMSLEI
jgi:phosphoribosyl 1,2-cyclic phosphate phosphodiesterase